MKAAWIVVAAVAPATAAFADDNAANPDDPPVVPYRPSVSTPAQLSAPGWLELEAGGLQAKGPGRGATRTSLPYTLKLAFTPDWGVRVGGEAGVRQSDGSGAPAVSGGGDTSVVLKRRFALSDAAAWGLELGETFATAGPALGLGHAATTINGIFSSDFAPGWHTDLNLDETRLGATAGAPRGWLAGWAAAFSRQLDERWGAVGELSGTHENAVPGTAQFLVAASYAASNAAVLDFGSAVGLTRASPHSQFFAGVTLRLGRLF
jgi:hypothetical protein